VLQVGGTLEGCQGHIAQVKQHPVLQGSDIDFKLEQSGGTPNDMCRVESGFHTLTVREVAELVTLGPRASGRAKLQNTGMHLSPAEFHSHLLELQGTACRSSNDTAGAVLIDARNVYESNIGRFQVVRALLQRVSCRERRYPRTSE
jgi:predicted sulfurtransferase